MLNHAVTACINTQSIKNKLSTFFSIDQTSIKEIIAYKEKLSYGIKLKKTKACSLAKILAKLSVIQQTASSYRTN
ncbi:MAG: hypothetical protein REH83_00600 [Rickettsiella sp.]|nr:hypothetical protein [Rickettsiella sp.]